MKFLLKSSSLSITTTINVTITCNCVNTSKLAASARLAASSNCRQVTLKKTQFQSPQMHLIKVITANQLNYLLVAFSAHRLHHDGQWYGIVEANAVLGDEDCGIEI